MSEADLTAARAAYHTVQTAEQQAKDRSRPNLSRSPSWQIRSEEERQQKLVEMVSILNRSRKMAGGELDEEEKAVAALVVDASHAHNSNKRDRHQSFVHAHSQFVALQSRANSRAVSRRQSPRNSAFAVPTPRGDEWLSDSELERESSSSSSSAAALTTAVLDAHTQRESQRDVSEPGRKLVPREELRLRAIVKSLEQKQHSGLLPVERRRMLIARRALSTNSRDQGGDEPITPRARFASPTKGRPPARRRLPELSAAEQAEMLADAAAFINLINQGEREPTDDSGDDDYFGSSGDDNVGEEEEVVDPRPFSAQRMRVRTRPGSAGVDIYRNDPLTATSAQQPWMRPASRPASASPQLPLTMDTVLAAPDAPPRTRPASASASVPSAVASHLVTPSVQERHVSQQQRQLVGARMLSRPHTAMARVSAVGNTAYTPSTPWYDPLPPAPESASSLHPRNIATGAGAGRPATAPPRRSAATSAGGQAHVPHAAAVRGGGGGGGGANPVRRGDGGYGSTYSTAAAKAWGDGDAGADAGMVREASSNGDGDGDGDGGSASKRLIAAGRASNAAASRRRQQRQQQQRRQQPPQREALTEGAGSQRPQTAPQGRRTHGALGGGGGGGGGGKKTLSADQLAKLRALVLRLEDKAAAVGLATFEVSQLTRARAAMSRNAARRGDSAAAAAMPMRPVSTAPVSSSAAVPTRPGARAQRPAAALRRAQTAVAARRVNRGVAPVFRPALSQLEMRMLTERPAGIASASELNDWLRKASTNNNSFLVKQEHAPGPPSAYCLPDNAGARR
jgi:hypothetical protein